MTQPGGHLVGAYELSRVLFDEDCDDLAATLSLAAQAVREPYVTDVADLLPAADLLLERGSEVPGLSVGMLRAARDQVHKRHSRLIADATHDVNNFVTQYPDALILKNNTKRGKLGLLVTGARVYMQPQKPEGFRLTSDHGLIQPSLGNHLLCDVSRLPKWVQTAVSVLE